MQASVSELSVSVDPAMRALPGNALGFGCVGSWPSRVHAGDQQSSSLDGEAGFRVVRGRSSLFVL